MFISAKTGQRADQVLPTALRVQEERLIRVPTSELNRMVRDAVDEHPPHAQGERLLKISYASQVRTDPPTFLFHVNDPELMHFSLQALPGKRAARRLQLLGHAHPHELPAQRKED